VVATENSAGQGSDVGMRPAELADVENILDVQEPGAVEGLANVFPQDMHPFPREVIAERWKAEIVDSEVAVYVSTDRRGWITGFAARRHNELLHFGIALDLWGTGLAGRLHDELLRTYPPSVTRVRLRVFAENHRARRFYAKRGWTETGVTSRTQFPPHPLLIEYARARGL
jgi:RimJ/RimL family protein N-acetyltransferase